MLLNIIFFLLIIISYLLIILIFGVISLIPRNKAYLVVLGIYITGLVFIWTILLVFFDCNQLYFQALSIFSVDLTIFNMEYRCEIDGLPAAVFFDLIYKFTANYRIRSKL